MKIIEPSATLVDDINGEEILAKLERCGRVSHKSKIGDAENFVRKIIKRGHESVLEHVSLTFHIVCDRAIMAELTRHRLASFTVESTRYVKYDDLTVINPTPDEFYPPIAFVNAIEKAEDCYQALIDDYPPEIARAVLPLCLVTELYMTANLREWRHVLKLRTSKRLIRKCDKLRGKSLKFFGTSCPLSWRTSTHERFSRVDTALAGNHRQLVGCIFGQQSRRVVFSPKRM